MLKAVKLFTIIFVTSLLSCKSKDIKIGLQPFLGFDKELLDSGAYALKSEYYAEITILPEIKIPDEAFVNIKTPRYRADIILEQLRSSKPDSLDYILGLTNFDISTSKNNLSDPKYKDWGVFGLGYMPGQSSVVSTFRLNTKSHNAFVQRLKNISIHEVGHNLGLNHCINKGCVMNDALETIKTIDQSDGKLCKKCRSRL